METINANEMYDDVELTVEDVLAVVKYKIANSIPITTAREELVEQFLTDWADNFGIDGLGLKR